MKTLKGSELPIHIQRQVLNQYVNRRTGTHPSDFHEGYPVQFKDDADWLANTEFAVRKDGELDNKYRYCFSNPTWPNNPELRK